MAFDDEAEKPAIRPVKLMQVNWPAGTRFYAPEPVRTPTRNYNPRLISVSGLRRTLPENFGLFEQVDFDFVLSNDDLAISILMDPYATRNPKNSTMSLSVGTPDLGLSEFRRVFTGRIQDFRLQDGEFRATARDVLGQLPEFPDSGYVTTDVWPNAYPGHVGRPIPFVYGAINSNGLSLVNPAQGGPWPILYIDNTASAYTFLVAGHAVNAVDAVYGDGQVIAGANYVVHNGVSLGYGQVATYLRFTSTTHFVRSDGRLKTMSCDVQGRTYPNTAGGTLISDPVDVIENILENYLDDPAISAAGFSLASATTTSRAYQCAGGYYDLQRTDEMLRDLSVSFDLRLFADRDGQISVSIFQPQIDAAETSDRFNDSTDFIQAPEIGFTTDQIINRIVYKYGYHHALAEFSFGGVENSTFSSNQYGRIYEKQAELKWTRHEGTALDIALRSIFKNQHPFARVRARTAWRGLIVDLADTTLLTLREGTDEDGSGWVRRLFEVREIAFNPDDDSVDMVFDDVQFLGDNAFFLGDEDSLADQWSLADVSDRRYGYLGDETTGELSGGSPAKRLL